MLEPCRPSRSMENDEVELLNCNIICFLSIDLWLNYFQFLKDVLVELIMPEIFGGL